MEEATIIALASLGCNLFQFVWNKLEAKKKAKLAKGVKALEKSVEANKGVPACDSGRMITKAMSAQDQSDVDEARKIASQEYL